MAKIDGQHGQQELMVFFNDEGDVYIGPEEKINLMEIILEFFEELKGSCSGNFALLQNQLRSLLLDEHIVAIINILLKYGARCDCEIDFALSNNECIRELVKLVDKIGEVKIHG